MMLDVIVICEWGRVMMKNWQKTINTSTKWPHISLYSQDITPRYTVFFALYIFSPLFKVLNLCEELVMQLK